MQVVESAVELKFFGSCGVIQAAMASTQSVQASSVLLQGRANASAPVMTRVGHADSSVAVPLVAVPLVASGGRTVMVGGEACWTAAFVLVVGGVGTDSSRRLKVLRPASTPPTADDAKTNRTETTTDIVVCIFEQRRRRALAKVVEEEVEVGCFDDRV